MAAPTYGDLMGFTGHFLQAARRRADEPIFVDDQRRITGAEAHHSVRALARRLVGVSEPQAVVAFFCAGSARHAVTWFAAAHAGRIACNLHLRETPEKLAPVLRWLEPDVVVYDAASAELATQTVELAELTVTTLSLESGVAADLRFEDVVSSFEPNEEAEVEPVDQDAIAAILLSSGTTGEPKGVMHSHRTLTQAAVRGRVPLQLETSDKRLLLYLQPSFAAWAVLTLPCATAGSTVIFASTFSPEGFLQRCQDETVTHAALVPTMSRMVVAACPEDYDLSSIEFVSLGGEAPSANAVQQLAERICPNIVVTYLASETLTGSCIYGDGVALAEAGKNGSTGRAAVGVEMKIVDPAGTIDDVLPTGTVGEIIVRGPSNAVGYFKAAQLTQQRFVDGWWRSGDLGDLDDEGDLWVRGRADNVINTGGIKVSSEEIESALLAHPAVLGCAVVGQPDPVFGHRVEAYFVPVGAPPTVEDLDRFLRDEQKLSGFKIPKAFHVMTELPTGATGKLYRRGLIRSE